METRNGSSSLYVVVSYKHDTVIFFSRVLLTQIPRRYIVLFGDTSIFIPPARLLDVSIGRLCEHWARVEFEVRTYGHAREKVGAPLSLRLSSIVRSFKRGQIRAFLAERVR